MALIDLVSDLSNFKGQSQYDDLDGQIKNGVDFIPNTDAPGFTPKTDLESLYNKVKNGTVVAPNVGVVANEKTRNPYGAQDEYVVANGIGIANPSHIISGDNILGVRVQPQFLSDFMTTPIAEYNSQFSLSTPVGAGTKTFVVRKEAFRLVEGESPFDTYTSPFSVETTKKLYNESSYIKDLFEFKDNNFTNVPSGLTESNTFSTNNFRSVANRNVKNASGVHPIILRKPGSNWDNYLNEKGIISKGGFFEGALGLIGLLTRTSRDLADKQRIGTYLLSDPGKLFLAKQVAFQALNPTIESKLYNPLSAVGIAGASDLLQGDISGLLRAAGSFLFPTHVERHLGGARYEKIILGPAGSRIARTAQAFGTDLAGNFNVPTSNTGVGLFDNFVNRQVGNVMRVIDTVDAALLTPMFGLSNPNKYAFPISSAPKSVVDGRPSFIGGADLALEDVRSALQKRGGNFNPSTATSRVDLLEEEGLIKRHSTLAYSDLKKSLSYEGTLIGPKELNENLEGLTEKDYESRLAAYDVVKDIGNGIARYEREDVVDNPVLGAIKGNMLSPNVDKVNITPYGASVNKENINVNDSITTKDFIKFRFKDVINNKFLIFRAILEGITDTVTPEYAEDRYIGRPDKLFVYQGVDRSIAFTFSLYPKTKQELPILMEKLNYLVGLCYPSYTEGERMISPFIELTMGDMFVETPGILSSLTVTVEEQSTWELDEGLQFPHFIKAACEFRHIGEYTPATKGKHYDLNWIESDGSSYETPGAPSKNTYTDKSELGFPLYPERNETWRKNVFAQLDQGKVGAEQ